MAFCVYTFYARALKAFVFYTALISIFSGIGLQFPAFGALLMPTERPGLLLHLFGLMALFLGVMLVLCSRDLPRRAPLVAWEGILRLGGCALMLGYGLSLHQASLMAGGLFDGLVGLAYLAGLPRALGVPLPKLLLDT